MNFIVSYQVYPFDLMVSIGETDEKLKAKLTSKGLPWHEDLSLDEMKDGCCCMYEGNQTLLRLRKKPATAYEYGVLMHEIFHCVDLLMKTIGVKLTDDSNEAYAYLTGYITEQIYKRARLC